MARCFVLKSYEAIESEIVLRAVEKQSRYDPFPVALSIYSCFLTAFDLPSAFNFHVLKECRFFSFFESFNDYKHLPLKRASCVSHSCDLESVPKWLSTWSVVV